MKKLLIALPFVATASWAGTTLYSGAQTRTAYDDLVAQLDAMIGPSTGVKISTESYSSGFAASSAVTQVRAFDAPDAPVLFRLRHEISHSPVGIDDGGARVGAARIVTTLLTDDMSEEVRSALALFDGDAPIVLESDVGFDRQVANVLSVAPLTLEEDGSALSFGGIRYDIDIDAAGSLAGTGTFAGASLAMADQGLEITLSPGTDRFAFERVRPGVYTGEQHMAFGTLAIENRVLGLSASLADVTYDATSALTDERIDGGMTLAVGRIESPLPLDSLSVGARVGGIDLAGADEYIRTVSELAAIDVENTDPAELLATMGRMYAALLAPGFSIDYDVAMSNAGGDVTGTAGLVFEGDGSASGHDAMTTVGELIRALKLSATLEADAEAVAMTPAAMFLAGDQLAPWIVSDGVSYRSDLGVDDLIVDINGNPMSLELMLGDLLAMPLDPAMLMMMAGQ